MQSVYMWPGSSVLRVSWRLSKSCPAAYFPVCGNLARPSGHLRRVAGVSHGEGDDVGGVQQENVCILNTEVTGDTV